MTAQEELHTRRRLWAQVQDLGAASVEPSVIRELGIYGGAQGIWVDKRRTAALTSDGNGVAVSVLHTGKHYPDDLSEEGSIYHYPQTERPPARDEAEVAATKSARELGLPIFVILRADGAASKRRIRLGWVEDWDDASRQFLILFGDTQPAYSPAPTQDSPFTLEDDRERRVGRVKLRTGQQQFRFQVLQRYGCKCAVCAIAHPQLVVAAHIRGKAHAGSDDWRNGLPLCHTHHAAFDAGLFEIEPETLRLVAADGLLWGSLGLTTERLSPIQNAPHLDALRWRWNTSRRLARTEKDAETTCRTTPEPSSPPLI
jgi:hypothetical protein